MRTSLRNALVCGAMLSCGGLLLSGCETAPPTTRTVNPQPVTTVPARPAPPPVASTASPPVTYTQPSTAAPPLNAPPPVVAIERSPADLALAEGVDLYNQGQYNAAIKRLQEAKKFAPDAPMIRIEADKYTAFSYCLTARRVLCRQHFTQMLIVDRNYELASAEANHPMWGGVFREAKAAALKAPIKR